MAGGAIGRRIVLALVAWFALSVGVESAEAVEVLDGRIQGHGFGEIQGRALSRKYDEEIDLSQWYFVFNLEVEADILPDGWGPFDLLQAYVRAEGRYDCIYSSGCGMFPATSTPSATTRRTFRSACATARTSATRAPSTRTTAPTRPASFPASIRPRRTRWRCWRG